MQNQNRNFLGIIIIFILSILSFGKNAYGEIIVVDPDYSDQAYKVEFICDEHSSIMVYNTQSYDEGVETSVAWSKDGSTGELDNSGNGQVNFLIMYDPTYVIDNINIIGKYKNLKDFTEILQENTYRITKIRSNLIVEITTYKLPPIENFGYYIESSTSTINFTWKTNYELSYIKLLVSYISSESGSPTPVQETIDINDIIVSNAQDNIYQYIMKDNVTYNFSFVPYTLDGTVNKPIEAIGYCSQMLRDIKFPRVEITSKNYELPTCDYVAPPEGSMGAAITNSVWIQNIISIYNSNGENIYLSSENDYSASKFRIRGNTSAYTDKKPYKIKLSNPVDLLLGLIDGRNDGKNYAHKDWLLLKCGSDLHTVIGWALSEKIGMPFIPSYSYVALYINGMYNGLYILCDSISMGNGIDDKQARIQIDSDGYIIEYDPYWWNENLYLITPTTKNSMSFKYTFKYPDDNNINSGSEQFLYIQQYVTDFENALKSSKNSYSNYINEETFAKWIFLHDTLGTYDGGGSNYYIQKKDSTSNSKLSMSTIWDLDSISSSATLNTYATSHKLFYFNNLFNKDNFAKLYNNLINTWIDKIMDYIIESIIVYKTKEYDILLAAEAVRWKTTLNYPNYQALESHYIDWFTIHLNWLKNNPVSINNKTVIISVSVVSVVLAAIIIICPIVICQKKKKQNTYKLVM